MESISVRKWQAPVSGAMGVNLIGPVEYLNGLGFLDNEYVISEPTRRLCAGFSLKYYS